MSTTIDKRVVEMRFDNKQFESNIQTSMSTLDKLKEKLNLSGAAKGLEDINSAAKNVNMSGLGSAVETVRTKFSALEVVAVTALANIANSAVNAGKQLVSSLTVEPVMDGFREYELTLNAVQTTMAGTGKTADEVAQELKKLDEYADKTVYSTADMLNNLPKFTNAGVELETATKAMIGIANATALAGGDAQKASIAFYNLGQAIGTGYLTRMDYNSINNAGIATMQWKEAMVEAAIAAGTLKKVGKDAYTTPDGHTFKMQQLFIDGLQDQWATTEVLLKVLGDYGDETTEIGKKSYAAATEIKTFSMMMDSLKASAGTGWKDTWQILFGDLEQAKKFWTGLYDAIAKVIDKMAEWRNTILAGALNYSGMDGLIEKIEKAGYSAEDFNDILKKVAKDNGIAIDGLIKEYGSLNEVIKAGKIPANIFKEALQQLLGVGDKATNSTKAMKLSVEELGKVVNRVINGDFGNGKARIEALTKAGYDYATVQNAVNEKLGISYRHVTELTEAQKAQADQLVKLSNEQLKNKGFTEEQIEALRELEEAAKTSNTTIEELMDSMTRPSGKELIFETLAHLGEEFGKIIEAFKNAWGNVFDPITAETLYNVIDKLCAFAQDFEISDKAAKNFQNICEGAFSLFQLSGGIAGKSVIGAIKILDAVLSTMGTDLLTVCGEIGRYITIAADWITSNTLVWNTFGKIGEIIAVIIEGVYNCAKAFLTLQPVKDLIVAIKDKFVEWFGTVEDGKEITNVFDAIKVAIENSFGRLAEWISNIKAENVPDIFRQMWEKVKQFGNEVLTATPSLKWLVDVIKDAASKVREWYDSFKGSEAATGALESIISAFDRVKEHFSKAYEIGKNVIEGLKKGLEDGSVTIPQAIGKVIQGLIDMAESILGIASPSKVFFAIGGFIIAGLVGGLLGNTTSVSDAMKTIGDIIINFFEGLDIETVIAAAIGVSSLVLIKKVTDILDKFANLANGLGGMTKKIGNFFEALKKGITATIVPSKWTVISKAIERVAISIALLAVSVKLLSTIDKEHLWPAVGALTAIAAIVGILTGVVAAVQKLAGEGNVEAMGNTLIKIAAAMGIMAIVAKIAASMSTEEMLKGGAALVAFGGIMVGLMAATKLISKNDKSISSIGGTLLKIAAAMGIMVIVAKVAASMSTEELLKGGAALVAFGGMMVGFMAATKLVSGSKNVDKVGGTLLKIAAAMGIMVIVAKVAASMSTEELLKGGAALVAFGGIIVGFMAATNLVVKGSKNVGSVGGALFKIAAAIGIMVVVAKIAAGMSLEEMLKGGAALVAFGGIIVGFMAATNLVVKGSSNVSKIGGALIKIAAAMGIMVIVAKLASSMSLEEMLKGGAALVAFGGIIVGFMAATNLLTANSKSIDAAGTALLKMAGAIAILAAVAALLCLINPERLLPATAALTMIMAAFAIVVSACKIADKVKTTSVGQLILMTTIVGVLAGIVALLSQIDNPDSALKTASALSLLVVSLSVSMAVLNKANGVTTDTIVNALLMSSVVGVLGGILVMLASFDVEPSITTAVSLSILISVLSGAMLILSKADSIDPTILVTVGLMAAIIGGIGLVIGILEEWDLTTSIATATAMSILLVAIAAALKIIAPLGPTAATAQPALLLLLEVIGILAAVVTAAGLLAQIPGFDEVIRDGGETLALIGTALGKFVGSIIKGFADSALSGLPALGQYLSDFMTNASGFIEGVKGINETAAAGAKSLCAAILALTTAELIDGIAGLINSETSLPELGLELSAFMQNMMPFLSCVSTVKPEMLDGVRALAETILILTAADVVQGLSSKIFGSEGGLDSFSKGLPLLGSGLASFVEKLGKFDDGTVTTVTCAANAVKNLADSADAIPNEGGWVAKLVGENSLVAFGDQLPGLGTALSEFVTNLTKNGSFGEDTVTTVTCAGNAIKALAEAASSIDGQADWAKTLLGDNSLATFGEQLGKVGTSLSTFVQKLGTFSDEQVSTVRSAVDAIKALTGLANADLKSAKKHLPDFGEDVVSFANKLASFCKKLPSTEAITAATTNIRKILNTVSDIANAKTEAVATFADSLKRLAKSGIDSFVKEMTSADAKADATKAGEKLVGGVIEGIESKDKDMKTAGTENAEQAVDGALTQTDEMESAGKDLGAGLVIGINAKKTAAYNAGYALGQAAVQGEKDGQQSNSPSKATIKAGHWMGDGLVIGMTHMFRKVNKAGYKLGNTATESISSAIAAIASGIDADMDMQPTIRPVVDLSEVRAGANAAAGLFTATPSVGILANVRAINTAMNRRNQNGSNDDIVSAIKDLKKHINTPGDTYTFGDFTYSEGSEVDVAVKSLVRALRMERRM